MPGSALRDPHHHHDHVHPCLAEGFRTCVYPATLVLKVERVFLTVQGKAETVDRQDKSLLPLGGNHVDHHSHLPDATETERRCLTLILSDGHLQVHGLLASALLTTELIGLQPNDIVRIKKFQVRTARRLSGQGKVVYFGISSCEWIARQPKSDLIAEDTTGGGFLVEDEPEQRYDQEPGETESPRANENSSGLSNLDALEDLEAGGFFREEDDSPLSRLDDHPTADLQSTTIPIRSPTSHKRPIMEPSQSSNLKKKHRTWTRSESHPATPRQTPPTLDHRSDTGSDDDDDFFETVIVSPSTIKKRQESLRHSEPTSTTGKTPVRFRDVPDIQSSQLAAPSLPPITPSRTTAILANNTTDFEDTGDPGPSSFPSTSHTHLEDPASHAESGHAMTSTSQAPTQLRPSNKARPSQSTFHTLSTLLSPTVPRQNYACTVLGLISWVSPSLIHRTNSPFPAKRNIRIHDLSITSSRRAGFTVAVFVDAKQFLPKVGTVALFRGVTMHRWQDEVILNAYVGLKEWDSVEGEKWFVDDEKVLLELGYESTVRGLKTWWEEKRVTR